MRWEMRTRLFLRTSEFLWQEGHTAHATAEEALVETKQMLDIYAEFAETFLGVPVVKGVKTPNETFAGAVETYCIEGLMQDGKALQMGTSHFLGQNFAKAFDVKFQTKEGKLEYVWATSWGVSTRLMGALIMAHSDDEGLVLPPNLAPHQIVIVPIYRSDEEKEQVEAAAKDIKKKLEANNISVKFDNRDTQKPGFKFAEWELKGVPLRIGIGPRDIQNGTVELARRDTKEKSVTSIEGIENTVKSLLNDIQISIFNSAKNFRDSSIHKVDTWEDFQKVLEEKAGFISAHWDGTSETEEKIKQLTKATIRCIPLDNPLEDGKCILTGNPSKQRVLFAKAY
jgi:prolyl-tRNA synthetase